MDDNQVVPAAVNETVSQETTAPANLFTQEQVNKLIGREKAKAMEAGRREAEEAYQRNLPTQQAPAEHKPVNSNGLDVDTITRQVQDKLAQDYQQKQVEQQMQHVVQNFEQKKEQGRKAYEDFDEVTKKIKPEKYAKMTILLSGIENGGDVLYELGKNPSKLINLNSMANEDHELAYDELLKLSKSILDNKKALAESQGQASAAPLDRLSPSRVAGSNGKMGIRDLRKQPWLRG